MHRPPLPSRNISGTYFCKGPSRSQGRSAAGRIILMKNSTDTIGNRSLDLPVCSAIPQPLGHHVPLYIKYFQLLFTHAAPTKTVLVWYLLRMSKWCPKHVQVLSFNKVKVIVKLSSWCVLLNNTMMHGQQNINMNVCLWWSVLWNAKVPCRIRTGS
jgi:hypothetical protein